jgi:hypothetical protein
MAEDEAVQFQSTLCIPEAHETIADFQNRWRIAEARIRALGPIGSIDADPLPLGAAAQAAALQMAQTETFRLLFGASPPTFVSVRLEALVAAQKYVDTEHVDTLVIPPEADELGVLDFCMRANPIDPPIVSYDGSITFSSHYSQNLVPVTPSFRVVDDHKVEVTASIISRPNYLTVAHVGSRFVVTNGYHRAVALLNAGHERLPCILKGAPSYEAAGVPPPGFFDSSRLNASRPPLVADYCNNGGIFEPLKIRARNHVLRVGFQVLPFEAPR